MKTTTGSIRMVRLTNLTTTWVYRAGGVSGGVIMCISSRPLVERFWRAGPAMCTIWPPGSLTFVNGLIMFGAEPEVRSLEYYSEVCVILFGVMGGINRRVLTGLCMISTFLLLPYGGGVRFFFAF